jgi:hypothetical protein
MVGPWRQADRSELQRLVGRDDGRCVGAGSPPWTGIICDSAVPSERSVVLIEMLALSIPTRSARSGLPPCRFREIGCLLRLNERGARRQQCYRHSREKSSHGSLLRK